MGYGQIDTDTEVEYIAGMCVNDFQLANDIGLDRWLHVWNQ